MWASRARRCPAASPSPAAAQRRARCRRSQCAHPQQHAPRPAPPPAPRPRQHSPSRTLPVRGTAVKVAEARAAVAMLLLASAAAVPAAAPTCHQAGHPHHPGLEAHHHSRVTLRAKRGSLLLTSSSRSARTRSRLCCSGWRGVRCVGHGSPRVSALGTTRAEMKLAWLGCLALPCGCAAGAASLMVWGLKVELYGCAAAL